MSKFIVTTTINPPTKAIELFDNIEGWKLIVVTDLKTPTEYKLTNGIVLSPKDQLLMHKELSNLIGWNCIQRRNFGFMKAVELGAELIATVDDDNIPYIDFWGKNLLINQKTNCDVYSGKLDCFDPFYPTEYNHLWHRGFPIQKLKNRNYTKEIGTLVPDIQANFWNGDPDIDAICRMEHAPDCNFIDSNFPFTSTLISPFNSQNTILNLAAIKQYFLFPQVGRMDDIWASFYVQSKGFKVIFDKATVYQDRNAHDLTIDFEKEVLGYINNETLVKNLRLDPNFIFKLLPEQSARAFRLYLDWMR